MASVPTTSGASIAGLYDVPRVNSLTGKPSSPGYTAIIDAVARRESPIPSGWNYGGQPTGPYRRSAGESYGSYRRPAAPDSPRQTPHRLQTDRSEPVFATDVEAVEDVLGRCGLQRFADFPSEIALAENLHSDHVLSGGLICLTTPTTV